MIENLLPVITCLIFPFIGICCKLQTWTKRVSFDIPKYKGYQSFKKQFDLKAQLNQNQYQEEEVIIVGRNNFSIIYDKEHNLIHTRGAKAKNCQLLIKLNPQKSIEEGGRVNVSSVKTNIIDDDQRSINNYNEHVHMNDNKENDNQVLKIQSQLQTPEKHIDLKYNDIHTMRLDPYALTSVSSLSVASQIRKSDENINKGLSHDDDTAHAISAVNFESPPLNSNSKVEHNTNNHQQVTGHDRVAICTFEIKITNNNDHDTIAKGSNVFISLDKIANMVNYRGYIDLSSHKDWFIEQLTSSNDNESGMNRYHIGVHLNGLQLYLHSSQDGVVRLLPLNTRNITKVDEYQVMSNYNGDYNHSDKHMNAPLDSSNTDDESKSDGIEDPADAADFGVVVININSNNGTSTNSKNNSDLSIFKSNSKQVQLEQLCMIYGHKIETKYVVDENDDELHKNALKKYDEQSKLYVSTNRLQCGRPLSDTPIAGNHYKEDTQPGRICGNTGRYVMDTDFGLLPHESRAVGYCSRCECVFCPGCVDKFCPGKHGPVVFQDVMPDAYVDRTASTNIFYCNVCHKIQDCCYPRYGCDSQWCNFSVCHFCVQLHSWNQCAYVEVDHILNEYDYEQYDNGNGDSKQSDIIDMMNVESRYKIRSEIMLKKQLQPNFESGFDFYIFQANSGDESTISISNTMVNGKENDKYTHNNRADNDHCLCNAVYIGQILIFLRIILSFTPIFDIVTDLWTIYIYINEGEDFASYVWTSIIILYFSNRLYFCCWLAVEIFGIKLNLDDNISFFDVISASLLPLIGYSWFNVNMVPLCFCNKDEFDQATTETDIDPAKKDHIQSLSKKIYDLHPKRRDSQLASNSLQNDETQNIDENYWSYVKELSSIHTAPKRQRITMKYRYSCMESPIEGILADDDYSAQSQILCTSTCMGFACGSLFPTFAALCIFLMILFTAIGVNGCLHDGIFDCSTFSLISVFICFYVIICLALLLGCRKCCVVCKGARKRTSLFVDLIYGPCCYTLYLIIKHAIDECKIAVKQFVYAIQLRRTGRNNYNRNHDQMAQNQHFHLSICEYLRNIQKDSLSDEESRRIVVLILLKSFVSIFESFPQLLLQCYVYFIVRSQYKKDVSILIAVQFYLSIVLSLISTARAIWRLLTNNLFQRGIKKAFDSVTIFSAITATTSGFGVSYFDFGTGVASGDECGGDCDVDHEI